MSAFYFHAGRSGAALKQQQVQPGSSLGAVNLLDETGASLAAGASADNLIYSALSTLATAYASGWTRRAAAYLAATSATAAYTCTAGAGGDGVGGLTFTTPAALTVQDFDGFADAILKASGYQDTAYAARRIAVSEGRSA